ncbi:MAG: hypothetical protein WA623_05860, partial [Candidatus Sulfotelmatobacter sp.]
QIFLLLPLLARPHRHAPILQTKPVDTSTLSAHESELAPRAAKSVWSGSDGWDITEVIAADALDVLSGGAGRGREPSHKTALKAESSSG